MEEKLPESDYRSVDPDALETYPLPPKPTLNADVTSRRRLVYATDYEEIRAWGPKGVYDTPKARFYDVRVEYNAEDSALVPDSVKEYLGTYEDARITQGAMTMLVYRHLRDALGHSNVFVELTMHDWEGNQKTRMGGVL